MKLHRMSKMEAMWRKLYVPREMKMKFLNIVLKPPILDQATPVEGQNSKSINPSQETETIEGNINDCNDLKLPIEKTLALWNIIESLPVFNQILVVHLKKECSWVQPIPLKTPPILDGSNV